MAAERVDYYSEEEYQQARDFEDKTWPQPEEPEVVPCAEETCPFVGSERCACGCPF